MAADGSIVIDTIVDAKDAQREVNRLTKKIQSMNDQIYIKQQQKIPLLEQSNQLAATLDMAKARLQSMQEGTSGWGTKDQIKAQSAEVQRLQKEWDSVQLKVERYDEAIKKSQIEIDLCKERTGDLQSNLVSAGVNSGKMAEAMKRAQKSAHKFALRLREIIRSALIFTVITGGLTALREWLVDVVKSNDDAVAAIGRLKAALLILAQPLVDVIIPAFTILIDLLTSAVMAAAQLMSGLFGTTVEDSKKAAENLEEESKAVEKVGEAAEESSKALAGFDEINKLSGQNSEKGTENEEIAPDFAGLEKKDNSWISDMLGQAAGLVTAALILGGIALIAFGAATANLPLVFAGLILLGTGVGLGTESEVLKDWADALGLDSVGEFVVLAILLAGIALVAIGAAMGNILLVIAGLVLVGTTIAYITNSGMLEDWSEKLGLSKAAQYVTAALLIGGMVLIVIGAITQNYLMVIAGLGLIIAGIYIGQESGVFDNWWESLKLSAAAVWLTAILIIGGMALIVIGIWMKNILMIVAGLVLVGAGVVVSVKTGLFQKWWDILQLPYVQGWITIVLLLGGIALTVFGILLKNVTMFLGGMAMLFAGINYGEETGTFDNWWDILGIPHADTWVTAALLIGGIALIVIGIVTANILMFVGGLALLAVAVVYGEKTGTFDEWWEALGLSEVTGWVTTALLLAGIALVAIGAITLNPMLVLVGLGLLGAGVAVGALNSSKLKGGTSLGNVSGEISTTSATPSVSSAKIPALASGAVIPPNREFLAILGDQTHGTNIEAPLSTIEQAVENVMQRNGGFGGGQHTVILEVDRQRLGRMVYDLSKEQTQRVGVNLVGGIT